MLDYCPRADSTQLQRHASQIFNLVYETRLRRDRERVTFDSEMVEGLDERTPDPTSVEPSAQLATEQEVSRILFSVPAAYRKLLILHLRDGMSAQELQRP